MKLPTLAIATMLMLAQALAAALAQSPEPAGQPVPVMFYQGVETDLEGLCISRR